MTFLATPQCYTRQTFKSLVLISGWTAWQPRGITLHNTGGPSLGQWLQDVGDAGHEKRLANIDRLYKNRHWHSGVHLFVGPEEDGIWNCCDLAADGIACTCTNRTDLQIEILGNYASANEHYLGMPPVDDWTSTEAQKVRDNAVFAMAVFCKHFGCDPHDHIRFHRDCTRDHHACPGGQVQKLDIIERVKAEMARV